MSKPNWLKPVGGWGDTLLGAFELFAAVFIGTGAAFGVAMGKFMLGGALAALALGVYLRFRRRRRLK